MTDVGAGRSPAGDADVVATRPLVTFGQATNAALDAALEADPRVFLIGEDISDDTGGGVLKVTRGLSTKYGAARVRSTPISEEAIVGAALGAALAGMLPVAEVMFLNFAALAADQLHNHAAKIRYLSGGRLHAPMTIRCVSGGGTGSGTGTHHTEMMEGWWAASPGLKVVMASSPADAYGLLLSCIFDGDPCLVIEHLALFRGGKMRGPMPEPGVRIPLGQASVVRPGSDVTLVGYGMAVRAAQEVADSLGEDGVSVEVIDLRTISPLDTATVLESAARTRRVVVAHESRRDFGVGAELSARIHEELFTELLAPVGRVGAPFTTPPASPHLEAEFLPSAARIEAAARSALGI